MSSCCSSEPSPPPRRPISAYTPLFVIVGFTALAALAKQNTLASWSWMDWMHDFMGFFLVVFAMVKFFNLKAFATGFAKYDLLAARSRFYGLLYPFLELGLGLAYLAQWQLKAVYLVTIALLGFGTIGVINTMLKGKQVNCACMGGILEVPVSTVTLTENLSMTAMALVMLLS
ncbi:MAG: hypothetical protein PVJ98_08620 [Akkermansiaceae bacterium]